MDFRLWLSAPRETLSQLPPALGSILRRIDTNGMLLLGGLYLLRMLCLLGSAEHAEDQTLKAVRIGLLREIMKTLLPDPEPSAAYKAGVRTPLAKQFIQFLYEARFAQALTAPFSALGCALCLCVCVAACMSWSASPGTPTSRSVLPFRHPLSARSSPSRSAQAAAPGCAMDAGVLPEGGVSAPVLLELGQLLEGIIVGESKLGGATGLGALPKELGPKELAVDPAAGVLARLQALGGLLGAALCARLQAHADPLVAQQGAKLRQRVFCGDDAAFFAATALAGKEPALVPGLLAEAPEMAAQRQLISEAQLWAGSAAGRQYAWDALRKVAVLPNIPWAVAPESALPGGRSFLQLDEARCADGGRRRLLRLDRSAQWAGALREAHGRGAPSREEEAPKQVAVLPRAKKTLDAEDAVELPEVEVELEAEEEMPDEVQQLMKGDAEDVGAAHGGAGEEGWLSDTGPGHEAGASPVEPLSPQQQQQQPELLVQSPSQQWDSHGGQAGGADAAGGSSSPPNAADSSGGGWKAALKNKAAAAAQAASAAAARQKAAAAAKMSVIGSKAKESRFALASELISESLVAVSTVAGMATKKLVSDSLVAAKSAAGVGGAPEFVVRDIIPYSPVLRSPDNAGSSAAAAAADVVYSAYAVLVETHGNVKGVVRVTRTHVVFCAEADSPRRPKRPHAWPLGMLVGARDRRLLLLSKPGCLRG